MEPILEIPDHELFVRAGDDLFALRRQAPETSE